MLIPSRRPWASFNSPVLHVSKIILIRLKQKESIKFALEVFIYINPSPYLVYRARCEDVAKSLTWEGCPDNIFHLYQLFQLKNYWVPPPHPPGRVVHGEMLPNSLFFVCNHVTFYPNHGQSNNLWTIVLLSEWL